MRELSLACVCVWSMQDLWKVIEFVESNSSTSHMRDFAHLRA